MDEDLNADTGAFAMHCQRLLDAGCHGLGVFGTTGEAIQALTSGIGPDRIIEAAGVDAVAPESGPAAEQAQQMSDLFAEETGQVAPETNPQRDLWEPGGAP
jgi:hypothetical protein